jgi:uncharacterized protein YdeI (YjbR/CyaY-like superfamily)
MACSARTGADRRHIWTLRCGPIARDWPWPTLRSWLGASLPWKRTCRAGRGTVVTPIWRSWRRSTSGTGSSSLTFADAGWLAGGGGGRQRLAEAAGGPGSAGYREPVELPELLVADDSEWRTWLSRHHSESPGVRLVLAKKGTTEPTTLSYDAALDEAICFGWIDGQLERRDDATFRRRFTPRRARSPWSRRNVTIAERLLAAGRMHQSGEDEVQKARADGRWEAAYEGQASAEVPEDLRKALLANPPAQAMFETLTSANRYAILYRVGNAKKAETRARRIAQFVEMLARGETLHPQGPRSSD